MSSRASTFTRDSRPFTRAWLAACGITLVAAACQSERVFPSGQANSERAPIGAASSHTAAREPGKMSWRDVAGLRVLEVENGAHDEALPMVVFIHGRGDHANPGWIEGFAEPGRYIFPQAPKPFSGGWSWFTYEPDLDPERLAANISRAEDQLARAITEMARTRPTLGKPIVAGFSQGAMLSFALAFRHPDSIALALPVSGMLPAPLFADLPRAGKQYPPVRAMHGTHDSVVPFEPTARMIEQLAARGLDVDLTVYQGIEHEMTMSMRQQMLTLIREFAARAKTPQPPSQPATTQ